MLAQTILAHAFESTDLTVVSGTSTLVHSCCAQVFGVQERITAISFREQLRWSLSDAREIESELMSEEMDTAAPPDAMPATFVFVLAVAVLFVAATGGGLTRLPWPDPGVSYPSVAGVFSMGWSL